MFGNLSVSYTVISSIWSVLRFPSFFFQICHNHGENTLTRWSPCTSISYNIACHFYILIQNAYTTEHKHFFLAISLSLTFFPFHHPLSSRQLYAPRASQPSLRITASGHESAFGETKKKKTGKAFSFCTSVSTELILRIVPFIFVLCITTPPSVGQTAHNACNIRILVSLLTRIFHLCN